MIKLKKTIIVLIVIFLFYIFISNSLIKSLTIPKDALRIRIIPNSNSSFDQNIKSNIKDKLQITMYDLLKNASSSEEASQIIRDNLDLVDNDVKEVLNSNDYNLDYNIVYGYNYFPNKEYKGIKYEEGYYESLLVTLGKGEGDNWWCILYPPLCLIEGDESSDVQYKSIVSEIIEKYMS